ncbi:MAG TPA: 3-keto-5-aminohexanoate cleavage protein [Kiloniellales bacterium]|nr:3-keto-5-aminohexanoate cleavage protein [Kiloniellales bacterium]
MSEQAWEPLFLAVAPNGARKTREDHPALPISPEELAATAQSCQAAGAAMIHLHVRDAAGAHSLDSGRYREATAAIREVCGDRIVIQITTEAVGRFTPDQQMACVREVLPEAASFAVRELIADANAEAEAKRFFAWVQEAGIQAQFILYSPEDVSRFEDLVTRRVLPPGPHFLLFVLGRYSKGQLSSPSDLLPFLQAHTQAHPWSLCAFGPRETACAVTAAGLNGHARVGFENNFLLPDGTRAPDNAALVQAVATGAASIGRPLGTAAQLRRLCSRSAPPA